MSKWLASVAVSLGAFSAFASTSLMPASIDFNEPNLWGKEVMFGFDDNGRYTGTTRWYLDREDASGFIRKYDGKSSGYLQSTYDTAVHRTITALKASESGGPGADNGQAVPTGGIYIDTKVSLFAYSDIKTPRIFNEEKDKINCWICVPEEKNGAVTNFIVTAGSDSGPKNYITDAVVAPGVEFRLMIKAVPLDGILGFEVYVNDRLVQAQDGTTLFPSMLSSNSAYASKLYSLGVTGVATLDKINFMKSDPGEDPEYDQDDVSTLRESAEITVAGYPTTTDGLQDFPALIRISEDIINGFHYSRCASGGSDIRFTDENGKLIPCEIDTWNPGGESLIWVKVPYFAKGTKITMHWALKTGTSAPGNNPAEVWSDYIAVWHMSEAGSDHVAKDSTGHGFTAKMLEGGLLTAAGGSVIGTAGYTTDGKLWSADYEAQYPLKGNFTFTGWYMAKDITTTGTSSSGMFGKKEDGWRAQDSIGWCGLLWAKDVFRFYGDGDNYVSQGGTPDLHSNWFHAGFVYSGNDYATMFFNGARSDGKSMTITPNSTNFMLMAKGVWADEIRIAKKTRSADWIKAEYDQATAPGYVSYGSANAKDKDNYWVVEPYVKPNSASVEDADTIVVYAGQPRYGTPVLHYIDAAGNLLLEKPTKAGSYKAISEVSKGVRDGLYKEVPFIIYEERAYHNIAGYDRVMLFNSDVSPESPVGLQGYYDADSATNLVWEHTGSRWEGVGGFVLKGNKHIYYEAITRRKLWEFRHARIGNLFQEREGLAPKMNFLPWGKGHACRFDDSEKLATRQSDAGTLILQNRSAMFTPEDPAAAYSPVYENGIGTVYFDAVNAYCGYSNRLKLQITTVTDEEQLTDPEIWTDVPVEVFAIREGRFDESMSTSGVTEITLAMNKAEGTTDWFYRIRALIDTNVAARVRIIRTDDEWNGGDDDEGLISIDNIIISNPAMGVKIRQYGAPADPNNLVLRGQRAPFDIAFPSVDDLGKFHAQVKVDYIVNNTNEVDTSFVGALSFKYRWRYLNQVIGDWTEYLLEADPEDPTRFVSKEAIEGLGHGDIEYYCSAVVNAPFYEYWDYSGLPGWVWPDDFTERRGNVWISAETDGVYSKSNLSPALGTDYFVRLREGRSNYEGFRIHVKRMNGAVSDRGGEEIVDMKLASDNTWRGFYQTITNGATNVYYYIEACNLQSKVGEDYQWNTNFYHGVNQADIPANDVLQNGKAWARLPCDELTGYLMFQLEDTTRSLSIIHADYQNFNNWTDAKLDTGEFLGTSTALPTSGVSRTVRNFVSDFSLFRDSVSSNSTWIERFYLSGTQVVSTNGDWAVNVPFASASTPNKWQAKHGQWVCENFRELGGKSMALQMEAEGYGELTMNRTFTMRGIERLTYDARIAQSYGTSRTFDYYVGTTNDVYNMNAYTFVVPCVMETPNDRESFSGVGTVSAVARYRDSKGGYEVRAERVSSRTVSLSLYKWFEDGSCTCLGTSPVEYNYSGNGGCSLDGYRTKFGALFISCTNTAKSVYITAGLMSSGQYVDDALMLTGKRYFKISYEDTAADRYTSGTCGVGSKDCPATFAYPKLSPTAVPWSTSGSTKIGNYFRYWKSDAVVSFAGESSMLKTAADYDKWNIYVERLPKKSFLEDLPYGVYGFRATLTPQVMLIEGSTDGNSWHQLATNVINSFGFSTFENTLYLADDYIVRFSTLKGSGGPEVVVDNFDLRQWRGEDYNNADNGIGIPSGQLTYGAPTNFVFTTAWNSKDEQGNEIVELSPMRTTVDTRSTHRPAGLRSPLMDGQSGRGLGLGAFSFQYRDADRRARLLVQICTNDIDMTSLRLYTAQFEGWTTVAIYDFSEMTEDALANGTISCYIGLHGIKGVMRVIVDPELVIAARDPTINPDNDPTFGRVFITAAAAKDNPVLDSGSWWGWNLRTTDDPTKLFLPDGDLDVRLNGLAYALNDSIENDTRYGDVYETHKPFLQTPILTRGAIGEVTFKARKYSASDHAPSVAIYGMKAYDPAAKDGEFEFLTNIVVNCERYETFVFQAPMSDNYTAFRLAVTGVDGITGDGSHYTADDPPEGPQPDSGRVARVLIDEVAVFEAIKARLGFCNVGAFRTGLKGLEVIPNMPDREQNPLCDEEWGIQTELYAVRLSERIDYRRQPRVIAHWYVGEYPWGYDNWKSSSEAHTAELLHAEGTNLVYRSSYLSRPTIVDAVSEPSVVQYSLEVIYYMEGQSVPMTNVLNSADWQKPYWYRGVDYNASHAADYKSFAAYALLDTVPFGYAWINEVNVYDGTSQYDNLARTNQYIEIAVPREADLTDWKLRFISGGLDDNQPIHTNVVATFNTSRTGVIPTKNYSLGGASNYVFITVGNYFSCNNATKANGTIDGYWSVSQSEYYYDQSQFDITGVIDPGYPIGIELIRPSGVIEYQVVTVGTNCYAGIPYYGDIYSATNFVKRLNELSSDANWIFAGEDMAAHQNYGVSVTQQFALTGTDWKYLKKTPGRINIGEYINPIHPIANGSSLIINADIATPEIYHRTADMTNTTESLMFVIPKGSPTGTNLYYTVNRWFEIDAVSVTSDGVTTEHLRGQGADGKPVEFNVGRNCSNSVYVVAKARINTKLREEYGLNADNAYTPAVIDWLKKGHTDRGEFANDDGEIRPAWFMGLSGVTNRLMALTEMYWLDIDPTIGNMYFKAGMIRPAKPLEPAIPPPTYTEEGVTNLQLGVYLAISNGNDSSMWAPYTLKGLEPGSNSASNTLNWTSVTFKVTAYIDNGKDEDKTMLWLPLRYFTFNEHSFDKNFESIIDIHDPHKAPSPGYYQAWDRFPDAQIFYRWDLDGRLAPIGVDYLQPTNSLSY